MGKIVEIETQKNEYAQRRKRREEHDREFLETIKGSMSPEEYVQYKKDYLQRSKDQMDDLELRSKWLHYLLTGEEYQFEDALEKSRAQIVYERLEKRFSDL